MKQFHSAKYALAVGLTVVSTFLASCTRDLAFGGHFKTTGFDNGAIVDLPSDVEWAYKRGFADFTDDGTEDMIEIVDRDLWFTQDFRFKLFLGYMEDGLLHFRSALPETKINIRSDWFTSDMKFDTAYVNSDHLADIVLTEYTQHFLASDTFTIKVALNNGDGSFRIANEGDLGGRVVDDINNCVKWHSSDDSIGSYLSLDWANFDGKEGDDLVIMCIGAFSHDLAVQVVPGAVHDGDLLKFGRPTSTIISDCMIDRSAKDLNAEDVTGDGLADIVVTWGGSRFLGSQMYVTVARNLSDSDLRFYVEPDTALQLPADPDWFGFDKIDFFQADGIGGADLAIITKKGGMPTVMYFPSKVLR